MATYKQRIMDDPRVESISDERSTQDGIWVELHRGYINAPMETHTIHEDTWRDCWRQLKYDIEPCMCEQCIKVSAR